VKRFVLVSTGLLAFVLAACAPTSVVANNVVPTLISATPPTAAGEVVLQGRYFGGGGENSYVLVGADVLGDGGTSVAAASWSPNRIVFVAPAGTGPGFVYVVVNDVKSNGLPVDLR